MQTGGETLHRRSVKGRKEAHFSLDNFFELGNGFARCTCAKPYLLSMLPKRLSCMLEITQTILTLIITLFA
jgi:hypothetical protein